MEKIKLGDPQPDPCKSCGESYGYQVTDNVRGKYTSIYDVDGLPEGGTYADSMTTTKKGNRAFCANCGADLKLKVERAYD
jgi:hypothetical protein